MDVPVFTIAKKSHAMSPAAKNGSITSKILAAFMKTLTILLALTGPKLSAYSSWMVAVDLD